MWGEKKDLLHSSYERFVLGNLPKILNKMSITFNMVHFKAFPYLNRRGMDVSHIHIWETWGFKTEKGLRWSVRGDIFL